MRLLLLRLIICSWTIPLFYIVFLPISYLMSGEFRVELGNVNELTKQLWACGE